MSSPAVQPAQPYSVTASGQTPAPGSGIQPPYNLGVPHSAPIPVHLLATPIATGNDPAQVAPNSLAPLEFPNAPSFFYAGHPSPVQPVAYQDAAGGPLVTDDRIDEDVQEVIRSLADQAQVQVVIDDSAIGTVTLHCVNEPFEKALDRVLLPNGLFWAKSGDTYVIAPANPDAPLFQYIASRSQYTPRYHDIKILQAMLPPRFKDFLHVSPERNRVMIEAPKAIADEILRCLQELDTPIPQVELEAIVCVTAPDSTFRFGLDWGHVVKVNNADQLNVDMTGLGLKASGSGDGVGQAFSSFAVTSAFVRLLAQEGYITIRAAPRVTAKDGEKAAISINRETFFNLQPPNSNLLFRQDVQKVEAGIMLEIIPRVHHDVVSVQIVRAEVSEDIRSSESRSDLTNNPYPIINRRQVSTDVNVREGHTIVIGGLVQRQTVDRVSRIPVLSKVPLMGKLFQTIDKQEQEAEVAIFISPRIVQGDSCVVQ